MTNPQEHDTIKKSIGSDVLTDAEVEAVNRALRRGNFVELYRRRDGTLVIKAVTRRKIK